MKEMIEKVAKLHEKTRRYGDEISHLLRISPYTSDPRSGCFGMIFNHLTLTLELLSYYHSIWSKPHASINPKERDRIRKENAERCVMALKWLFVASLSSIEYSAKASLSSYAEDSPAKNLTKVKVRYVYLSDIMRNSKNSRLISNSECEDWQNMVFLRNCMVHNNGVSDIDRVFDIADTRVVAEASKMLQGKLDFFTILTEVAIERYFTWVKAIIQKYGN